MTLLMLSTEHSSGQKSFFFGGGGGWAAVKMEGMEYYVYSLEHQMGVPCAIF